MSAPSLLVGKGEIQYQIAAGPVKDNMIILKEKNLIGRNK